MNRLAAVAFVLLVALLAVGLLTRGIYGYSLFFVAPMTIGAVPVAVRRCRTRRSAILTAAATVAFCNLALLFVGKEGLYCILMSLPLTVPAGMLGGWLYYECSLALSQRSERRRLASKSLTILLALGGASAALRYDLTVKPPVFETSTRWVIQASPEQVWPYTVAMAPIQEAPPWFFRGGVAYPLGTRALGVGVGAPRYCDLSTGSMTEVIDIWDPGRTLRFRVTSTPQALHEISPWGEIQPKHLHGYYVSHAGQFRLTRLDSGDTLVVGTSWYSHGLYPAGYWRLWTDVVVHGVHERVLREMQRRAEADVPKQIAARR